MSEKQLENTTKNIDEGTGKAFVKARDKYSDMKSSALCLFIIAIIGLAVTIMDCFDLLPIKLNANDSWIFYFAMFSLYTIFIIVGIYTIHSAKKVKSTISDEEAQTDTIITWALDNLSAKYIDEQCAKNRADIIAKEDFVIEKKAEEDSDTNAEMLEHFERTEAFEELPEELKCFDREEFIASRIKEQFDIDDSSYIAAIIEEIYPEIFE